MADHVQKRFADLTAALEDAAGLASDGQAIELNKSEIEDLVSQIDIHLERARSNVRAIRRLVAKLD
jgi:hypothetical protein